MFELSTKSFKIFSIIILCFHLNMPLLADDTDQSTDQDQQAQVAVQQTPSKKGRFSSFLPAGFKGNISDFFKKKFNGAKKLFGLILNAFLSDITYLFNTADYVCSPHLYLVFESEAAFEAEEVQQVGASSTSKESRFHYDFGYGAAGTLAKGFVGFDVKIESPHLPIYFAFPFKAALKKVGFKSMVNVSGVDEFMLKMCMLASSIAQGHIDRFYAMAELTFLLDKLSKTMVIKSIDEIIPKQIAKPLMAPLGGFSVAGNDILSLLKLYWPVFTEIKALAHPKEGATYQVGDFVPWCKSLIGVLLPALAQYDKEVDKYFDTLEGAEQQKLINKSATVQELTLNKSALNAHMPTFAHRKKLIKKSILEVVDQFPAYKDISSKIDEALKPTMDAFLSHAGLTWDEVKPLADELKAVGEVSESEKSAQLKFDLLGEITSYDQQLVTQPIVAQKEPEKTPREVQISAQEERLQKMKPTFKEKPKAESLEEEEAMLFKTLDSAGKTKKKKKKAVKKEAAESNDQEAAPAQDATK